MHHAKVKSLPEFPKSNSELWHFRYSFLSRFWVKAGLDNIDHQVEKYDEAGIKEYGSENHGIITIKRSRYKKASQAWYKENTLDNKGAAN